MDISGSEVLKDEFPAISDIASSHELLGWMDGAGCVTPTDEERSSAKSKLFRRAINQSIGHIDLDGTLRIPVSNDAEPRSGKRRLTSELRSAIDTFGGRHAELISGAGLAMKRTTDLLGSITALALLWPLMLLISVAIKWESRGPILYRAPRVGRLGRRFTCYKFRTMVAHADEMKPELLHRNERRGPFFKIADDPRITRLGRILRRYSLDELPQFWNILRGEMSLVGPRPHPIDDVARYSREHHSRLMAKPGLTGLWQISARTNPSFRECMRLDTSYITNWSWVLDFKILLRTLPAVVAGKGD